MAIIKTITTERGVIYPDQYCRVDIVRANKTEISFDVGIYFDEQTARNGMPPHRTETFGGQYDLLGDNPWVQAYGIIKQHWPDAVDA